MLPPDLAEAERGHLEWLTAHGLLRTDGEVAVYESWALPDLVCHSFPCAGGAELRLLLDAAGWVAVLDDHFDGPAGRSAPAARTVVAPLLAVLRGEPTERTDQAECGLTTAWRDLWLRQSAGAAPVWLARAAADWRACFTAFVEEAAHRQNHTVPTLPDAVPLRRDASCVLPFTTLLERVTGVPPALVGHEDHDRLRCVTADIASYLNDLYSLARDERRGEPHNLVLILRAVGGLSKIEAIEDVRARIHRLTEERDQVAARVARAHPRARPYLDGMLALLDGVRRWSSTSGRYLH